MASLFDAIETNDAGPLADRLRPREIDEVVGQEHVLGKDGYLRRMMESGQYNSLVFWGPPGCGKTTLARLIAKASGYHMETVSAVTSGVADLKKVFEKAAALKQTGARTLLFVDEIHRFNRSQQDAFLPHVENGTIVLVGATTENPSFELNAALLSRARVVVLKRLNDVALDQLLARAEERMERALPLTAEARASLLAMADGDGRYLLNMAEELFALVQEKPIDTQELVELIHRRAPVYDKHQDSHYNLISALHKSLRGSDTDAALYWFNRMLAGGEDPLYIARRLVRFAVEDIGLADPEAVHQALAAKEAYDFLGSPEGELALAQAVIYLGTAPKSNAGYVAFKASKKDAQQHGSLMPPKHILNAPTKLMKAEGYGTGYAYDHDATDGFSGQNYFPEDMERQAYYRPVERGFERELKKRQDYWAKLREKRNET
jgi:putative ATPase